MRVVVYPLWLRRWHAMHGLAFVLLLFSGLRVHYADASWAGFPFAWAVRLHDAAGLVLVGLWVWFVIANALSGNAVQYRPHRTALRDAARQLRWYVTGMLRQQAPPFQRTADRKFNPLQGASYLVVMYALLPACAVSGCFLFFPELAPDQVAGGGGVWPMALIHLAAAWALSMFFVIHLYMITTGPTPTTFLRELRSGVLESTDPASAPSSTSSPEES